MSQSTRDLINQQLESNIINLLVKVGILFSLFYWCFNIIKPFIVIVLWAIVIAVSLYPLYSIILTKLNNKKGLTTTIFTFAILSIILLPIILFSGSMIDGVQMLSKSLEEGTLNIPPPTDDVKQWPLVGDKIYSAWSLTSSNLGEAITKFTPQLKSVFKAVFATILGGGIGILQFIISIIIAGFLMMNADRSIKCHNKLSSVYFY